MEVSSGFPTILCDDDENEVGEYAEVIANLLPFPMAMQAAVELDLFQIIAGAEESGDLISAAEIADRLSAPDREGAADKLDRILRLLAAFLVVTCSVDGGGRRVYRMAPAGRYFVRGVDGASLGPFLAFHQDQVLLASWRKLKDGIMEGGIPSIKANGMNLFECSRLNPVFKNTLNQGMLNHTTVVMNKILKHYKGFDNLKQLVDVGGGVGHTLKIIVSKYTTIKGINFDLPHVIENALSYPGIDHVSGDMFESVPSPAEAIFMKWMLHGFSNEHCIKLLLNCYHALPSKGKVIVIEHVLDNDQSDTTTAAKATILKDVLMMTQTGGRERTKKEYIALANAAQFPTIKFACYACNFWVMEFCK